MYMLKIMHFSGALLAVVTTMLYAFCNLIGAADIAQVYDATFTPDFRGLGQVTPD